jgi:ribonuclease P protein subunit RPR2
MTRIAQERIHELFALAESTSRTPHALLADRYVGLARRIGTRYNIRLLPEYRNLYCRGCSKYWVEGRTVRTRLRGGRRVQTCLGCHRIRRTPIGERALAESSPEGSAPRRLPVAEGALVESDSGGSWDADNDEEEDQ